MAGRQAKILAPNALRRMLLLSRKHACPARSQAIILLSVKAGMRAGEIAKLEWPMVLTPNGKVSDTICVEDRIAKKKSGRRIPMHPDIHRALVKLYNQSVDDGPVIQSNRGGHMNANSIVNWFATLYREAGLDGCSSHSGRRTFVTQAAKMTHKAGGSLRDVQLLAGHQSIETTQRYIDGDTVAQRRLIQLL